MIREIVSFIKRNGAVAIFKHSVELYLGAFFKIFPGVEGLLLRSILYRFLFKKIGKNLLIYPNVFIIFSHKISVGNRVAINVGTYLDGRGEIEIGNNVMIGPGVIISSADHSFDQVDVPMCNQDIRYGKIIIKDDVWIGANSTIANGVKIGEGTVIVAGSFVNSDLPPYSIVSGIPAKVVSFRK